MWRYCPSREPTATRHVLIVRVVVCVVVCACVCVFVLCQSKRDGRELHPHQLIFTPPYESEAQPIEKLWAKAKGYVARVHRLGRKPKEVRADIITGLYCGNGFSGITAEDCRGYVRHGKATANGWIRALPSLRAAYRDGSADERMTVDTFNAQCRARYRIANPLPEYALDPDSSDSTDSAIDDADSDASD